MNICLCWRLLHIVHYPLTSTNTDLFVPSKKWNFFHSKWPILVKNNYYCFLMQFQSFTLEKINQNSIYGKKNHLFFDTFKRIVHKPSVMDFWNLSAQTCLLCQYARLFILEKTQKSFPFLRNLKKVTIFFWHTI